jgi:alpha-tubulin suppressor-like RCC1 family protein
METIQIHIPPTAPVPLAPNRASTSLRYAFAALFALFALLFAATPDARAAVAARVAAGTTHSLFVTEDGKLWAAGLNNRGQLGLGASVTSAGTPLQVPVAV